MNKLLEQTLRQIEQLSEGDQDAELRGQGRAIIVEIFRDLFGLEALGSLTPDGRKFLGMGVLDVVELNSELDV